MTALQNLADRHRLTIIEDAAQAHGTERDGIPVGGSGRLTCFSFIPARTSVRMEMQALSPAMMKPMLSGCDY